MSTGPARAQALPKGTDRAAAAESLYEQAVSSLGRGEVELACQQFEASQKLDEGLGTLLHLANCYELVGKTASAWAKFREAEALATARSDAERGRIANERASELEPLLSRLVWQLPTNLDATNVRVLRNGVVLPNASLGVPLPVDPGPQTISVSAPGKRPYETTVLVPDGPSLVTVDVPELASRLEPPEARARERARRPVPEASRTAQARTEQSSNQPSNTLAYAIGGTGLVTLGGGALLGWLAKQRYDDSLQHCIEEVRCTTQGVEERKQAERLALASTLTVATGGLLLGGALWLHFREPSGETERRHSPAPRVGFAVAPDAAQLKLEGSF